MEDIKLEMSIKNKLKKVGINCFLENKDEEIEMDSISLMMFVVEIEKCFEIEFEYSEISVENFSSINSIKNIVKKYLSDKK